MKKEIIEKYGNDFTAYDATETFKPLAICYVDDEYVLTYDVQRDKHNFVKLISHPKVDGHAFAVNGVRYHLENFLKVGSPWDGLGIKSIEEWKDYCNK